MCIRDRLYLRRIAPFKDPCRRTRLHKIVIRWHPAQKKGYSGVSTWSRIGISEEGRGISTNVDIDDSEGRVLHTKHGNLHCINIYLPNGGANIERQKFKDYKINTKVPIETSLNKSITSLFFILMQP